MIVHAYVAVAFLTISTTLPVTGEATYYNPQVFQRVWEFRSTYMEPCPECAGFVAMLYESDMGRKVWVEHNGDVVGPMLVIDCATPWDRKRLEKTDWVIDLPWWLAQRWEMSGPIEVTVHGNDPRNNSVERRQ